MVSLAYTFLGYSGRLTTYLLSYFTGRTDTRITLSVTHKALTCWTRERKCAGQYLSILATYGRGV